MLLITFLIALNASADVRFEAFALKPDNSFEVQYSAPTPQVARGVVNNASRISIEGAEVTTTVQPFGTAFVLLTFIRRDQEMGQVVLLEQLERGRFARIHHKPILGQASTLLKNLDGIFADLKRLNGWDASLSIRAMVSYFDSQSDRKIKDFYDAVELGHMRTVQKPDPRGRLPAQPTSRKRSRETKIDREERRAVAREIDPPAGREKRPPRQTRVKREPQPWEPRRLPPPRTPTWAPWQPPPKSAYPGQRY